MTRKWRRNPLETLKMDSEMAWLFLIGRDEQAAKFSRRVRTAGKLERRAFVEIAGINGGVGSGGADNAFAPIVGEAEVSPLDAHRLEPRCRPARLWQLGALQRVDRP